MKKEKSRKKKIISSKYPVPVNGWLKLWLAIIDKEMDDFHVEDFKNNDYK